MKIELNMRQKDHKVISKNQDERKHGLLQKAKNETYKMVVYFFILDSFYSPNLPFIFHEVIFIFFKKANEIFKKVQFRTNIQRNVNSGCRLGEFVKLQGMVDAAVPSFLPLFSN